MVQFVEEKNRNADTTHTLVNLILS